MPEIDPVVLEVRVDADKYIRELRAATRTVDQHFGLQERRVKKLEAEFRRSSTAISSSLKGLAGTLATAFTGRELVRLIDSYTQLQNSLRVAGLEGENLAQVQGQLVDLASKNGVAVNALADLYGKTSQAGQELGATQDQLLRLTENTALALRISGTNAQAAAGAILGLTQALSSSVVRAEEFNQINEGGLRPLLQAAAASDRFGGSVARLRNAVVEGKLSSEELFQAILQGSDRLRDQAAKSVLTVSGAFEALNNKLIEYVGSNASATGATGLLSGAIQSLAENLETVIEALAVIVIAIGTRYAAALAVGITRTAGLSAAAIGLGVTLNGVAATSRAAGVALAGAFGGPIGLAVGALTIGIAALAIKSEDAADKTARLKRETEEARATLETYQQRLRDAGIATDGIGAKADEASKKVRNLGDQLQFTARQALDFAEKIRLADLIQIGAERNKIARERAKVAPELERANIGLPRLGDNSIAGNIGGRDARVSNLRKQLAELEERDRLLQGQAQAIIAGARAGVDVVGGTPTGTAPTPATPTGSTRASGGAGRGGPDFAAIDARFRDELDSIRARIAAAESVRATTAEERAEFERRQLELAEAVALRSLEADKDYTDAQRAIVRERLLALGEAERDAIAFRERAEIERRNLEIAEELGRAQIDGLRLQFDIANTEKERRTIALQILDAENSLLRERLEAISLSETANEIERERARIALAALNAQEGAQRAAVGRQFATPLERFALDAKDSDTRIEAAIVRRLEDINDLIANTFTDALGIKDPFLSQLIQIFLEKNIFGPLAESLAGSGGGGLGSVIGSLVGSLFGRSSGGRVTAGRAFRVNEGAPAGRVEGFIPDQSGTIIPLGRMNATQGGAAPAAGGVVRVVIEEAPGFAARVQAEAVGVAIEVVQQSAPSLVDAAANETARRFSRPQL